MQFSANLHARGRLVLRFDSYNGRYWFNIEDDDGPATAPAVFVKNIPGHILKDACDAFNKVVSEAMEGVDENGSL